MELIERQDNESTKHLKKDYLANVLRDVQHSSSTCEDLGKGIVHQICDDKGKETKTKHKDCDMIVETSSEDRETLDQHDAYDVSVNGML